MDAEHVALRIYHDGRDVHIEGEGRHFTHAPAEAIAMADEMDRVRGYATELGAEVRRVAREIMHD